MWMWLDFFCVVFKIYPHNGGMGAHFSRNKTGEIDVGRKDLKKKKTPCYKGLAPHYGSTSKYNSEKRTQ